LTSSKPAPFAVADLTLVDSYLLASMIYVLIVVASNAILVQPLATKMNDDADGVELVDLRSLYASAILWVVMHIVYFYLVYANNKKKDKFLNKNGLVIKAGKTKKSLY
jgi:hypothetical protein